MRRYALSLLVEAAGCSEAALGRRVGLSGTTLKNARLTGFTEQAADRYACRLGRHSVDIWPDFGMVTCEGCGGLFASRRVGHRFCVETCQQNTYRRFRYATDPDYAGRRRAANRAFYAECAEVMRAKQRARDRAKAMVA